MALNPRDRDWQTLAVQASKEMDGAKLTTIVALLCSALDERLKPPASTGRRQIAAASKSRNPPAQCCI